jgi:hypothetical protein
MYSITSVSATTIVTMSINLVVSFILISYAIQDSIQGIILLSQFYTSVEKSSSHGREGESPFILEYLNAAHTFHIKFVIS